MVKAVNPQDIGIIKKVYDNGQEHIFKYWDELDLNEKNVLLEQVKTLDFNLINEHKLSLQQGTQKVVDTVDLDPAPFIPLPVTEKQLKHAKEAESVGKKAIMAGKVAAFLVAGGQGTRLGFNGPKGCYPIGPVSRKTLFQMHAEKIMAASKKYDAQIPWVIMTSETNDAATRLFFEQHDYFGLGDMVRFFTQRNIPALTEDGAMILDKKNHIFMNPNGHGGSLLALQESGTTEFLKKHGVELLSYFQVDNVLINIIDPVFIGYHLLKTAEMSSKMVLKNDPLEKVGIFGISGGKLKVIEYSDMSKEDGFARNADGSFKYGSGSIAIHLINIDFVEDEIKDGFKLPYHTAYKKVPYLDNHGCEVLPDLPNACKFETFIFDALADTQNSIIMEIDRKEEFSPVKNTEGIDSVVTAKQDMSNYFAGWLEAAGVKIPYDQDGNVKANIEIDPLFAADKIEFIVKTKNNPIEFCDKLYIDRKYLK